MLELKSTYPIGIDIQNQHIYAAQFKKGRRGLAVRGLWHKRFSSESESLDSSPDFLIPLITGIAKYKGFCGKKAIVHMPFQEIFAFPIRFQVGNDENVEELIVRESRKYLPFPVEEAVIDYPSISPLPPGGTNQYTATIVASRREHTRNYLKLLKQAGLVAEIFDFGVSALVRLHNFLFTPTDNPIVLGNIGHTESLLSIVTKEDILAQHHVAWGVQTLIEKLQVTFEYLSEKEKARILLINYGLRYEERQNSENRWHISEEPEMERMLKVIYQLVTPHVEELIHECHKLMAYVRSEAQNPKFEGVFMYGLANMIGNLDVYIEKKLQLPTKLVNPLKENLFQNDTPVDGVNEGADFAMALGLAMRKVAWP